MFTPNRRRRGFSLIELLIVIAIILIIITIAVPKLSKAKQFAQETAAIQAIHTIWTAQVQFSSQYGRFATSLTELGPPATGNASAASADLIHSDLASGEKEGYKFTLTGASGNYQVLAVPVTFGTTGSRTFYSDQTMVLRVNDGPEPATANSKELNQK
jgi:prepilin-type N-terminal cleavage/methylation domain-containing protein